MSRAGAEAVGYSGLWRVLGVILVGVVVGCSRGRPTDLDSTGPGGGNPRDTLETARVPLTDLGSGSYLGFVGGLYPAGANGVPADHGAAGAAAAREIRPLDAQGAPSPQGKYVLLSVGMSNTTQEFCSASSELPCDSWTFMGLAAADPEVNRTTLRIVNGARGGQAAGAWDSPNDANYDRVRDTRLHAQGLTEKQVRVVWLKVANPGPAASLPSAKADAYLLQSQMGDIARTLRIRYPNLEQVFLSSRIYGGFATTTLNPEPFAYESGFAVKWLIQAQIEQVRSGGRVVDARAGDLGYPGRAPWLAWGPYLWADGASPRADGLSWQRLDFEADGTHPSRSGEAKVGAALLAFFKTSPSTRCWFTASAAC